MTSPSPLVSAAALGAIAGLRSMTAPAAVSRAAHLGQLTPRHPWLAFLAAPASHTVGAALAAGELVADKLPFTPARINPGPLAVRIFAGALCGAVICSSARKPIGQGALLGGLGALAGSYAGYEVRKRFVAETGAPDPVIAVIEDAIALTGALWVTSRQQPA